MNMSVSLYIVDVVTDVMLLLYSKCIVLFYQGSMGDSEYLAAFQQIVMPVAYEVRIACVIMHVLTSRRFWT